MGDDGDRKLKLLVGWGGNPQDLDPGERLLRDVKRIMRSRPRNPDEALAAIRECASMGELELASDEIAREYRPEIIEIYRVLYEALNGRAPKRDIWTSDGVELAVMLQMGADGDVTAESARALAEASAMLGVMLTARMTWEEAGLKLRALRRSGATIPS